MRVLCLKFRDSWLFSYDELQFGNQIHHEQSVWAQGLPQGVAPVAQLGFALGKQRTDQALKGLR